MSVGAFELVVFAWCFGLMLEPVGDKSAPPSEYFECQASHGLIVPRILKLWGTSWLIYFEFRII